MSHSDPCPLDANRVKPTSTPSYVEFLERIRRSQLVAADDLDRVARAIEEEDQVDDLPHAAHLLASRLLQENLLTPWQHRMLQQGRVKRFFLGQYKLLDQIGAGGMSRVYLAEHMLMRRLVAIKVAAGNREEDKTRIRRFIVESQVTASLDHPHIVKVFHLDREFELYYLVMEYVAGLDLRKVADREGPLSFTRVARYMSEVADGLAHLHARGLIHRDVKPGNLLVDEHDRIKILDLGLARVTIGDRESLTGDQRIVGTIDFIAPEQIRDSRSVDARTDLYSLGATMYYLLTGQPPFLHGSTVERLHQHLHEEPTPIQRLRPDVPERLAAICRRLMCKDPAHRYQTADEVRVALDEWLRAPEGDGEQFSRMINQPELATPRITVADGGSDWFIRPQTPAEAEMPFACTSLDVSRAAPSRDVTAITRKELEVSLERMAHGVAHRFNNLLQCLLGEVELAALETAPDSRLQDNLSRLADAARRASDLTNQLGLITGKGKCLRSTIGLSELLRTQAPLFSSLLPSHIRLQLDLPSDLPAVSVDLALMHRLLLNLITNAKEALEPHGGTITLRAGVVQPSSEHGLHVLSGWETGAEAYIEVEDTGRGMPDDVLRRIFEPFFSTRSNDRGLGLAVAKGIAAQHHGSLTAHSTIGQGTRMRFSLPCEELISSIMPNPMCESGSQLAPQVLVVDDEFSIRELVRRTLERFGFVVQTAENGEEAIALFRSAATRIDLVVLDLTLPGLDGEAVLGKIRQIQPDIPVIVSSGSNDSGTLERLAKEGGVEFLQKPYQPMALVATARKVLQARELVQA